LDARWVLSDLVSIDPKNIESFGTQKLITYRVGLTSFFGEMVFSVHFDNQFQLMQTKSSV
jgi:hypothetical protein